jgi:ABC-type uncharacterized transport system substrate-binding protein
LIEGHPHTGFEVKLGFLQEAVLVWKVASEWTLEEAICHAALLVVDSDLEN